MRSRISRFRYYLALHDNFRLFQGKKIALFWKPPSGYSRAQESLKLCQSRTTESAMDKFRSDPTPENGIAAHQQLLGFHQLTEAAEFQKTLLAKFPDNAKSSP